MTSVTERQTRIVFYLTLAVFALGHLYYITAPPNGYHRWRESHTATVILNYYQEDMSFLRPQVNEIGALGGVTGMEFPVYSYAVALLYHLTGPSHLVARLVTLLAALLALWFFHRLVAILSDRRTAFLAGTALALSPLFFFYSHKIMPDVPMLAFCLAAMYFYLSYLQNSRRRLLALSALLLAIAAAIKPLALCVFLPLLLQTWRGKDRRRIRLALFALYMVVTLLLPAVWLAYARKLQQESGIYPFYLGSHISNFYEYLFAAQFWKKNLLQWPWELWIGWTLVPLFLWGIIVSMRNRKGSFFFVWAVASYTVVALVSCMASSHDYYTLLMVPPLAAITGYGAGELFERGSLGKLLVLSLAIISPLGLFLRLHDRFIPTPDFDQIRAGVQEVIPRDSRVIVEDDTGAIRLYELDRKGWPLRSTVDYRTVRDYVERGGKFLLLDKPLEQYDDSLRLLLDTSGQKLGPLYCYRLKE